MDTQDTKQETSAPLRRILLLTTAAMLALVTLMVLYTRHGDGVLARLEVSVGEVLLDEGRRFQEAGALANARERYERALESRFEGPQNRAATEKRLGQLLYDEGDFAGALPHLEAATQPPHVQINAFELRVEALQQLERWDEIAPVLEAWRAAADAQTRPDQSANAGYYAGQLAAHRGDMEAAERAYTAAITLAPGGSKRGGSWPGSTTHARTMRRRSPAWDAYLRIRAHPGNPPWEWIARTWRRAFVGSRAP